MNRRTVLGYIFGSVLLNFPFKLKRALGQYVPFAFWQKKISNSILYSSQAILGAVIVHGPSTTARATQSQLTAVIANGAVSTTRATQSQLVLVAGASFPASMAQTTQNILVVVAK